MKVTGTKLDNSEYDAFESYCNEKGLTKSEQLRQLVKNFLDNPTQEQTKQTESTGKPSRPEFRNVRISYDGKTWYDAS